ncbi:MAG: fatty acid desaturase [Myxococcales bacterium]|nr:fatty acid desaturase [Myxococcales bacterium]
MSAPAPTEALPTITLAELARHGGQGGSYWIELDDRIYDVSGFSARHPGGGLLALGAGRPATTLFEAYHPGPSLDRARKALAARGTLVGTLAPAERTPYGDPAFFDAVRGRVDDHLRARGLGYHSLGWLVALEAAVLVLALVAAWAVRVRYGSYLAAVVGGLVVARLGFVMHSGNHAATSRRGGGARVLGGLMDFIGGSTLVWRYAHQVSHHGQPNVSGADNDAEIGFPLLRFHPALPRRRWHRVQVLTLAVGMSVGLVKWLFADFSHLWRGRAIHASFHVPRAAWVQVVIGKALWLGMNVVAPVVLLGPLHGLATTMVMMAVGAYYMEGIFIVNHLQADLVPRPGAHWAEQQVQGTANWGSGKRWTNWVSGGLNHQIEHHLFPSTSIYLYPTISPIVRATCAEFGLPYRDCGGYLSALGQCLSHLHDLGRPVTEPAAVAPTASSASTI